MENAAAGEQEKRQQQENARKSILEQILSMEARERCKEIVLIKSLKCSRSI